MNRSQVLSGLSALMLAVMSLIGTSTGRVAGAVEASASLSAHESLVTAAYYDFLGRYPTESEMSYWARVLDNDGSSASMFASMANSTEWVSNIVNGFYLNTLGRPADQSGLAYWVGVLTQKTMTPAQVAAQFYASNEYFNGIGGGTVTSWATDLYAKLFGRAPDQSGLQYWVSQVALTSRVTVAYQMYQSNESCRDRVTLLYGELLHRTPDAGGLTYWARVVATKGDVALAEFLAESSEYASSAVARFGTGRQPPGVPTTVTTTTGLDTITVSWVAPATIGSGPVTGYTVTASPGGETCSTTGATTCLIAGLEPGTSYTFSVVASNGDGAGAGSVQTPPTTPQTVTKPGAPTGVTATVGDAQAVVTWTAPASDGGAPISSYLVISEPDGRVCSTAGSVECTVTGLNYGTSYTFTVTATNSVGVGTASDPSQPVVPSLAAGWQALRSPQGPLTWIPRLGTNSGVIIGDGGWYCSETCSSSHRLIDPPGSSNSQALSVNASGTIVGTVYGPGEQESAALWTSARSPMVALAGASGFSDLRANLITDSGLILGSGQNSEGTSNILVWASPSAQATVLSTPDGMAGVTAKGATEDGEIVGTGTGSDGSNHPLVWPSAAAAPTLMAEPSGYHNTVVEGVSSDQIYGFTFDSGGVPHLVVWSSPSAIPTVLESPPGVDTVHVIGITSSGTIVGTGFATRTFTGGSSDDEIDGRVIVWPTPASAPTVLQFPDGFSPYLSQNSTSVFTTASGLIAATGVNANGKDQGVAWSTSAATPVALTVPNGIFQTDIMGVSPSGEILGMGDGFMSTARGLIWPSLNAQPTEISYTGTLDAQAIGMTASGVVVGHVDNADGRFPYYWPSIDAEPVPMAYPAGYVEISVCGVSPSGVIVANGVDGQGISHSLMWPSLDAVPTVLAVPPNFESVTVEGVNSQGVAYGTGNTSDDPTHGLVWSDPNSPPNVLNAPSGDTLDEITGVSAAGVIVGMGQNSQRNFGFVWASTQSEPSVLADPSGSIQSYAQGVSADGVIYGRAMDSSYNTHVVEWTTPTSPPVLFQPPQAFSTDEGSDLFPVGIDAAHNIYGDGIAMSDGTWNVVVWPANGGTPSVIPGPTSLGIISVTQIAGSGDIVGSAEESNGSVVALVRPH